jgi:hypothetical protein
MSLGGSANGNSVNVDRLELLEILKKNREKHVAEYNLAVAGYPAAMIKELQDQIKAVKKGTVKELHLRLPRPTSYEENYTEVIEMLEMSVDKTIHLDRSGFKSYIKDEWGWSGAFKAMSSSYSSFAGAV